MLRSSVEISKYLSPSQEQAARALWKLLPDARLVGGAVRDILLGRTISDLDFASSYPPLKVKEIFEYSGIQIIPTGLAHGTVTALLHGVPCEITTLRRDVETDGRHAVVEWTDDWKEDAQRRDFTFNAMSCDRNGVIYDYFCGQDDLIAGRVRFVGDPEERITEDALRILRFFRFYGRYGRIDPDARTVKALTETSALLEGLSPERVWSEVKQIFGGPRLPDVLDLMQRCGILRRLFPDGDMSSLSWAVIHGMENAPLMRLGLLLFPEAHLIAEPLRLSRAEEGVLRTMMQAPVLEPETSDADVMRALAVCDANSLIARTWITQAKRRDERQALWNALRDRIVHTAVPSFPLAGRDVVQAGVAPGVKVGHMLMLLRQWWLDGGCAADAGQCLVYLQNLLKEAD